MAGSNHSGAVIDLPDDIQRELRDLESRAAQVTHYELLGVGPDADGAALRRAYLVRSKRFHPDAWYRANTGEFGPLLSKWFRRLTQAWEVLGDEESRRAYDAEHVSRLSPELRAAVERRELTQAETERRRREGRERLLRAKGFARIGAARKLYADALEMAENGERTSAIATLKAARELDPNRKEIAARLIELERGQARARAVSALQVARERAERQMWPQALNAFRSVLQLDPHSFEAAQGAARASMELGDLAGAARWAQLASELNPLEADARLLLVRALAGQGLKSRARAELTLLLHKHPEHKEAKALLRGL